MSTATTKRPASPQTVESGRSWHQNFRDLPREHGFEPLRVEGKLPEGLVGTLYRDGPSLFSNFNHPYQHWFDGDGAVSAVRLSPRGAEGAVRLVQSKALVAERAAGKPLYGSYGTRSPGLFRRLRGEFKNPANTSVVVWNDRLLALNEAALPTELEPETLATIGETDLDGVVLKAFSAHPHRLRERRTSYNFGVRYGRFTELDVFELPDAGPARRMTTIRLAGSTMIHDFIATPNHLVFFAPPLRLRLLRLLLGINSYGESLVWKPELGTEVIVVPIDQPAAAKRFTVEPFYQWHFANAFERGQEIVVDLVRYPDFKTDAWLKNLVVGDPGSQAQGRFGRATLNPVRGTLAYEERWNGSCEFPRVGGGIIGQPYRFAYLGAHSSVTAARTGLFDQIAKLDVDTGRVERGSLGAEQYPSEAIFVSANAGGGEDAGYLLTHVYDGRSDTTHLAILDAQAVDHGPLARIHFDHAIPFTFHGFWQGAKV